MRWKLALAQHPMYLLIREDTQCAERTPPWGAPTIEAYIERVRQNLASLERYSRLKLGYEWSGVELELLAQDAPEIIPLLRHYIEEGRISFYNGTFAQPHLQILSSESNLRQFQFGQRVYQELGLKPVTVYAHQEASVHDQVPQLLGAFGIPFATVPGFLTTLVWLDEGELLLHGIRGPRFLDGQEFVAWQGLDGSQVPLYLHQPIPREMTLKDTLAREVILGRLSVPPLLIDLPDMIAIDDSWMAERSAVDFTLLDEVLKERLAKNAARASARLFTNWSYLEGIRAEELSRSNWKAEREALRAEAIHSIAAILARRKAESTDAIWKTILSCQHHDAYCFSAPELREKSIGQLQDAAYAAGELSRRAGGEVLRLIQTDSQPGQPVVVFHTSPQPQTGLVEISTTLESPEVINEQGEAIPCETRPEHEKHTHLSFLAHSAGLGYTVYWIRKGEVQDQQTKAIYSPIEFENRFYRARINPDGTIVSLVVIPTGVELIDSVRGPGNTLRATDSSAISFHSESPEERVERYLSDPPIRGPRLVLEPAGPAEARQTPVGMTFQVSGRLGERAQADLTLRFYNQLPRIDLDWDFRFDQASIGTFFDDDSKLLIGWPLSFKGKITHDIPFGVTQERENRPFFPTSWLDISDGENGIAFFHQGTPKHWVSDQTVFNLLGWGEDTDAIHNGLGRHQWLKAFDQRLSGRHSLHHAIYPHEGDWRTADLPRAAREYGFPPVAYLAEAHPGTLPASQTLLHLTDPSIAATSLQVIDDQVVCRVCAAYGLPASPRNITSGLHEAGLRLLTGEKVDRLNAYQIGELRFELGASMNETKHS